MCLAIPGRVLSISGIEPQSRTAEVSFLGAIRTISLALAPDVGVDDFILAHASVAIKVLDEATAMQTLDYLREMDQLLD